MKGYYLDPDSEVVDECFAVVYAPKRRRDRFPENCVKIMDNEFTAIENSDPDNFYFAAKMLGPARSSEGFRMFYLIEWLNQEA
ncbi:MAG: hypothetical protein OEZ58_15480 [Gammaproteobacteria bacterium]|nr:hypothetical protein [Gammaproteobacteria bacterium]MDH5730397.1 hypothetical protein [Gammaproteobacteria bacterium]